MGIFLDKINSNEHLKKLSLDQLPVLCQEIRDLLVNVLSKTGGHLASNLGAVEFTVALHYVFDSPRDKFCWDVGHQAYVHKILTGRKNKLKTVRMTSGLSGFPNIFESKHDQYSTGHAGTSISQALGEAVARDHKLKSKKIKKSYNVVAITGDASIASGLSFEALNHSGYVKSPFLIILNDNEMSISPNVGALNYTFSNFISNQTYTQKRKLFYKILKKIPVIGLLLDHFFSRVRISLKNFITENHFFESFGFRYMGPIDGHDVIKLVRILNNLKKLESPTILHLITKKGKGYKPAEKDPVGYHGVKPFEAKKGNMRSSGDKWPMSKFVGECISELAKKQKKIYVITPAMKEGSGLVNFAKKHTKNFFDVGIAEQHSVTFSGSLAKSGMIPFLCIYSTFLQRAYDQLIQDVALMNFPVRFVIDRAGCVGGDGETHQGLYDISYMACIPNMRILSASNPKELMWMLSFMSKYNDHPISVRFPKKDYSPAYFQEWLDDPGYPKDWSPFKSEIKAKGKDVILFTEGTTLDIGMETRKILDSQSIRLEVVSLKSLRPLDEDTISKCVQDKSMVFTLENHVHTGGVGQIMLNRLSACLRDKYFHSYAYPEKPIQHGDIKEIEHQYRLDAKSLAFDIYQKYLKHLKGLKSISFA